MAVKYTRTDLEFILEQIKMAETNQPPVSPHLAFGLREVGGTDNNSVPGQTTFGSADQIFPHTTNSLFQTVTVSASMLSGPLAAFAAFAGPDGNVTTSYAATAPGNFVIDAAPRIISNLIVDQTANNPAAVAAQQAAFDVLGTGYQQAFNPAQASAIAGDGTLFINNVTPDAGLSAPFNSLFTFFGQFFDHGLDLINKGGNGTVFVPLAADDPLRTVGPDGIAGNGDEVPDSLAFMVLTRATNASVQPGADGVLGTSDDIHFAGNTITPFVDQSQTYGSAPSHQVFLREYTTLPNGTPFFTGNLLSHVNADGSHTMATWADVKANALRIGIVLNDTTDLVNLPMIKVDAYGKFIPNAQGLAQIVTGVGADGLAGTADDTAVSGSINPDGSINAITTGPAGAAIRTGHAFLNDINANADPVNHQGPGFLAADGDNVINGDVNGNGVIDNGETAAVAGTYDNELLNAHYIAGDGRVNENIGLTAIHEIFHDEHNRLVQVVKDMVLAQLANGDQSFAAQWVLPGTNLADGIQANEWNGDRLFQAAKFGTETQYQHLVFEEFARKVAPTIHLFGNNDITLNSAITSEFANVVYRFGHSMLDENVNRYVIHEGGPNDPLNGTPEMYKAFTDAVTGLQTDSAFNGATANVANAANVIGTPVLNEISLIGAFTNPLAYLAGGGNAAGEIILGSANQVGNEIDEFITGALRNNLLGLPLDLASLNLARGRDVGVAGLNVVRNQLYSQTPTDTVGNAAFHDTQLKPYASWDEFGQFLKHSDSLINFVAAYGTHQSVTSETTLIDKRMAAYDLVVESQSTVATTALFVDALGQLTNLQFTDAAGKHTSFSFTDATGHYTNYGYLDALNHAATVDSGHGTVAGLTLNVLNAANPDPNAGLPAVDAAGHTVVLANPDFAQDAFNFMHSTGAYVNDVHSALAVQTQWSTGSVTGLDAIDLWVGGLAEKQSLFGGLLGTTFNYIFETQLESLQDGDRLYYLPRIEGTDYGAEIENNSFAELIAANTHIKHLSASIFLTPEYVVEAATYFQRDAAGNFLLDVNGNRIATDSSTWLHNKGTGALLVEVLPDNTVHFIGDDNFFGNTMVLGGTDGNDRLLAGQADDDTVWGDGGDDVIDGGGGNDFLYGGTGNDTISDSAGDDVIHADAGDDTINAGIGGDIVFGGDGNDFIELGAGLDEANGGLGNDIILGGEDDDALIGGEGDDWLEGGAGGDGLVGDQGAPTGQVPLVSGNDVLDGGENGDKMQGFSGDDIMLGQGGFDKFLGELGFDWGSYEKESHGVDVDQNLRLFVPNANQPAGDAVRDFWVSTEGLSGSAFNDDLKGEAGGKIDPLNELANTGLIFGLQDSWNGAQNNFFAPGTDVHFSDGNIILGGGGSDRITGDSFKTALALGTVTPAALLNGGNDIIDGDAWLHVELLQGYQAGSQILREIVFGNVDGSADHRATDVDTAVYNDVIANYVIRYDSDGDGVLTIVDNVISASNAGEARLKGDAQGFVQIIHSPPLPGGGGTIPGIGTANDGTDMVRNIERLEFFDKSVELNIQGNIALTSTVAGIPGGLGSNRLAVVNGGGLSLTDNGPVGAIAAPVIGDTLSFNNANRPNFGITDADGIVGAVSLQWQKQDVAHPGWINITGATSASFVLPEQVLGDGIRLVASYTDGKGMHEQVISDFTVAVAATPAINHAPIINQQTNPVGLPDTTVLEDRGLGGPHIAGGPAGLSAGIFLALDQVFSDDNTPLTPGGLVFKATLAGTLNGVNVDGIAINAPGGAANAAGLFFDTLTTNAAGNQVGHLYSLNGGVGGANFAGVVNIRMTVTDAQGLSVTDTFAVNVLPQNDGKATFNITGARTPNSTLTVSQATPDPDGGLKAGTNYAFQWLRDGNIIAGATLANYATKPADNGHDISVRAVYTDAQGFKETVNTDAGFVTDATIGNIFLNDNTPTEGQTLFVDTSGITDNDGLGPFSFQWQSSTDATNWTNIAGATAASLNVPDAPGTAAGPLAGLFLRVVVNVSDLLGNASTFIAGSIRPVGINYDASGSAAAVTFIGTAGDNIIVGSNQNDTLSGAAGDDIISGGNGNDTINGGIGNDSLFGDAGNDTLSGNAGDDAMTGGAGNDALNGNAGDDVMTGSEGNDTLNGNAGNDTAVYAGPVTNYVIGGTAGTQTITDVVGTEGADNLNATETFRIGGTNYAVLLGDGATSTVNGGAGSHAIFGFGGADVLNGGTDSDILIGGAGNDTINGGGGDDFIYQLSTGEGQDFIDGGAGSDTYILSSSDPNAETFRIYTRAAAIAAGINVNNLNATTEIVITRNSVNGGIIAQLDNIEEIKINTLLTTANNGNGVVDGGATQGDTVIVIGNFNQTSLAYSTIRVEGSAANDTIDISGLTSEHRVVFDANGGTDSFIGGIRPQDVVTGIPGIGASALSDTSQHIGGIESDFQLMALVDNANVTPSNLLDHFALQSGGEFVGLNMGMHTDMIVTIHDLDTTVIGYPLLQA